MADSTTPASGAPSLGTEIFHRLQLVLKEAADESVEIDSSAADALRRLEHSGRSHLAVLNGGAVVGVFSYRSFARGALQLDAVDATEMPCRLSVEHFVEEAAFRRGEERIDDIMPALRDVGAVVVGEGRSFNGVATLHDVMEHLFRFAQPFVLLTEVEHAIRALMTHATTPDQLAAISRAVIKVRHGDEPPARVEEMMFGQYLKIILHVDHFSTFQPAFGGTSAAVQAKLKPVQDIRNDIFHFKRVIGRFDYTTLKNTRNWLSRRVALCTGGA